MAEWRFGRGWTDAELKQRLASLPGLEPSVRAAPQEMTPQNGWNRYHSTAVLARESSGPPVPAGAFRRARVGVRNYEFSDPRIVVAHFDRTTPVRERYMLLEIKVLGLRYLCGVVVGAVRDEQGDDVSTFGYRYDTLDGHIERGSEWFLLTKVHETGEVRYRIDARWRPGQFPNWWSRVGFRFLAPRYQERWHHRAQRRLYLLACAGSVTPPRGQRLVHQGPDVIYKTTRGRRQPCDDE